MKDTDKAGLKRLKVITSHVGLSRWLAEVEDSPQRYIARVQVEEISSPYAYSPCKFVYRWNGKDCVEFETSHKRYEIFEIPSEMLKFKTDQEATDWHIKYLKTAGLTSTLHRCDGAE